MRLDSEPKMGHSIPSRKVRIPLGQWALLTQVCNFPESVPYQGESRTGFKFFAYMLRCRSLMTLIDDLAAGDSDRYQLEDYLGYFVGYSQPTSNTVWGRKMVELGESHPEGYSRVHIPTTDLRMEFKVPERDGSACMQYVATENGREWTMQEKTFYRTIKRLGLTGKLASPNFCEEDLVMHPSLAYQRRWYYVYGNAMRYLDLPRDVSKF